MPYALEMEESCKDAIRKSSKKNPTLRVALEKKIAQILEQPQRFKSLRYPLNNLRRVHALGSFVLVYEIDETRKTVRLLKFAHHDDAYAH